MALTYKQEKQIRLLRERNLGYRAIAAQLGLSRDTVRNFCRKWWSENPQAIRQSPEALYEATCLNCGKVFTAYGNNHRRYCSHACYIQHRFGSCASQ